MLVIGLILLIPGVFCLKKSLSKNIHLKYGIRYFTIGTILTILGGALILSSIFSNFNVF